MPASGCLGETHWSFHIEFLCALPKHQGVLVNYEANSMCIEAYLRLTFLVRQTITGKNFDFLERIRIYITFGLLGAGSSSSFSFTSFCATI